MCSYKPCTVPNTNNIVYLVFTRTVFTRIAPLCSNDSKMSYVDLKSSQERKKVSKRGLKTDKHLKRRFSTTSKT